MAPSGWDPYKDLLFLQERMSRVFDEAVMQYGGEGLSSCAFPPVDIYETDQEIILKAELPGLDLNDISIEVRENILILRGERRLKKNLCEENFHRMERFYGTFERVFSLPNVVDRGSVKVDLIDGVLKIAVPKVLEPRARRVKIKID